MPAQLRRRVRLHNANCGLGDHCASGIPAEIKGFICFDIHEVIPTPDGLIKGDFLCPTDPRCDNAGLGPGGDIPGTISSAYPVIVD